MREEGWNGFLRHFQHLRSNRDEIETPNRKEIPFSSQIVPRGLSVAERPWTVLHNASHLYSDQADPLGDPAEIQTWELTLGATGIVTTRPRQIPPLWL